MYACDDWVLHFPFIENIKITEAMSQMEASQLPLKICPLVKPEESFLKGSDWADCQIFAGSRKKGRTENTARTNAYTLLAYKVNFKY